MVQVLDHWLCQCTVCKDFGCIWKQCWPRFSRRSKHHVGVGIFEDHMNMLIKRTKISNPAGDLVEMRNLAIWGNQKNVDWQMTFLDRCQMCIDQVFQVGSPRWQIGYVEIV